jgi:secernin
MCDSLVALKSATANKSVIYGKSADCEVNEANALVRIPRMHHVKGEMVRTTHLMIPQAEETYEIILTKACWTYGCEIGINEFGLAMGEEAVYTTEDRVETGDGLIGPDLARLALERTTNCQEAIELMTALLEQYGQGGNGEMKGNSHFDSSFMMADRDEAYILETAGRKWAVKKVDTIGSISNMLSIRDDWDSTSASTDGETRLDWATRYGRPEVPPMLGSLQRQHITYQALEKNIGNITIKTIFNLMRQHGDGYNPAKMPAHQNICVHVGPQKNRWWQADGGMVTEADDEGIIVWVTGTSGTCVSIFKPVFLGLELPDIGPEPTNIFNPQALWWKHELLHRRAMRDFDRFVPEIRNEFDKIEAELLENASGIKRGSLKEKKELMEYSFRETLAATGKWIKVLSLSKIRDIEDQAYGDMWDLVNNECGISKEITNLTKS